MLDSATKMYHVASDEAHNTNGQAGKRKKRTGPWHHPWTTHHHFWDMGPCKPSKVAMLRKNHAGIVMVEFPCRNLKQDSWWVFAFRKFVILIFDKTAFLLLTFWLYFAGEMCLVDSSIKIFDVVSEKTYNTKGQAGSKKKRTRRWHCQRNNLGDTTGKWVHVSPAR